MPVANASPILEKLESVRNLPTVPAVLIPLLQYMEQPVDKIDVHQVVNLISQDKSLAGHCLQVANSALFGCSHQVETIQTAVVALGLERVQQIAASCSLLRLMPDVYLGVNPSVFWSHSLACALVAREFAVKIGFPDPAKAYAAGLLHDIGIIAILWVSPHDFRRSYEEACHDRLPLHDIEEKVLGITHCETGKLIARNWRLSVELTEVIGSHHRPAKSTVNPVLTSIVCVSDLLCRLGGLGYGYSEGPKPNSAEKAAFSILETKYPSLRPFDLARFSFDAEMMLDQVRTLVSHIYGVHQ